MEHYKVIGVMSGTSLDGIDLVCATFQFSNETWSFECHNYTTVSYNSNWKKILKSLVSLSPEALKKTDTDYTIYLANNINNFIEKHKIENIDAICSHGHTALHQPDKGITYQIGNTPELASLLKQRVVCDFRVQDVALGGQGAPLVPIGDKLLFSEYDYCINLGGFANVSTDINDERIAYDICPVNIVLNHYVTALGYHFDNHGEVAKAGTIHQELLNKLNALDFYTKPYPKSLGLEWVNQKIFPLIDTFNLKIKDVLRTFVEHVAVQISKEINNTSQASVLITGGGAYNTFLIQTIENKATQSIIIPGTTLIEFKEAIIFGFLGVLKLREDNNCLASVTGAKYNHSSGKIYNH